jgi:putative hydrolase of the HAD superfamily
MKLYKAVIFDLDNTLLNYDRCELDSMQRAIRHHRIFERDGFVWEAFWKTFLERNAFYWEQRFTQKLSHLEAIEFALRDAFEIMGTPMSAADVTSTYWEFFCNTCHFEKGALETLRWAHRNYKLGILSNGIGEAQHRRLKSGDIDHYFDAVIVSDEVGYWKPDPKIFHVALEKLNLRHDEVLFVGDSLRDDYVGALNSGVDFCYYNRNGQKLEGDVRPTYMIKELSELVVQLKSQIM